MRFRFLTTAVIGALAAIVLFASPASAFSGLTNPSFESPGSGSGQINAGSGSLTGWTVGGAIDYVCGGWQNASGNCSVDMAATPSQGEVSQVMATTVGNHYTVRFMMAGNPGCSSASAEWVTASWPLDESPVKTVNVSATGTPAASYSFDVTGKSSSNMGWVMKTYLFTAAATSTTLTFQNGANLVCGAALDKVEVTEQPAGPATLGASVWQGQRPYSPVSTPNYGMHGDIRYYDHIPAPGVPVDNSPAWANCGPGNSICPNANTIGLNQLSRLGGYSCLAAADFTFYQAFVSIPFGTTISQFSVNMSGADDGARVAIYNSAHPGGFVFAGSYIFLGGAQSTTDMSSAMVAGEVNRVVITQVDDCYSGNNLNSAQIFLNGTVLPPTPPADTTPPVVTPTVTGTLGNNDWYTSDINVSWTVTDAQSAITAQTGCDPATVTANTASVTFTCTATSAGGTATGSVTVKRDATAPVATATAAPAANGAGWNNTDVTVTFTGVDGGSGIASCTAPVVLGEGAGQSASGTCTDNAGNVSAPATASNINVDKTNPVVTVTGVTNGASYIVGGVPAAGCSTTDALSGVATSASLSTAGGPLGAVTVTCAGALDAAGNAGAATTATYTVTYALCAARDDDDRDDHGGDRSKGHESGSTIPVKIRVCDANGRNVGSRSLTVKAISLSPSGSLADAGKANPGNFFRFDDGQYIFNLQTKGLPAGTYTLDFQVGNDPTVYHYSFTIRPDEPKNGKSDDSKNGKSDDKDQRKSKDC